MSAKLILHHVAGTGQRPFIETRGTHVIPEQTAGTSR